jgi:hypothetical protein
MGCLCDGFEIGDNADDVCLPSHIDGSEGRKVALHVREWQDGGLYGLVSEGRVVIDAVVE